MNRDELEKWMKDQLDKAEFVPNEAGWNKFQAAVNSSVKKDSKKAVVFLLPKKLGIAASVFLFIMSGSLIWFMSRNKEHKIAVNPIIKVQSLPATVSEQPETKIDPADQLSGSDHQVNTYRPEGMYKGAAVPGTPGIKDSILYVHAPEAASKPDSPATKINVYTQPKKSTLSNLDFFEPLPEEEQKKSSLDFGIAAQFGKANIGNMRYQLGVVARKKISEKFYAEATLAFASTEVSYIQKNSFQSFTINASVGNSIGTKSIDAKYGSNIISAGISPSIGYKITPKLALGCGLAVYHNLDQSLSLQNGTDIESTVLSNHLISNTNPVSSWDAGLTGSAACNVGSRLTINLQYRHGLSTFMYSNNQAIKNSGFNMGLNYLFGK